MEKTVTVRPMGAEDIPAVGTAMARAFHDDPVGVWMFPSRSGRLEGLTRFFDMHIRNMALDAGECLVSDDLGGAALWKPPGTWKTSPLVLVRLLPRMTRLYGRRLPLLLRGLSEMERVHPREPHFYLPMVGVAPHQQGRGIGSALLAPVLQRCDAEGLGTYLEATNEANRRLYVRHGFEVTKVITLPGDLTLWSMWRDPA